MRYLASLLVMVLVSGCERLIPAPTGTVLAKVNNRAITQSDFDRRITELPEEFQEEARKYQRQLLEDLILEELLYQEAQASGFERDPATQAALAQARRRVLIGQLIEREVNAKVTIAEVDSETYYNEHREAFAVPKRYRASHILVKDEGEARQLREALKAGAELADLARRHSMDASKNQGGDLGYFVPGDLVPEFEEVAMALEVGEISEVVKTPFGYHVIQLTDIQEAAVRPLEEVLGQIRRQLQNERRQKALDEFLTQLRQRASIQVLLPVGEPQVVPPASLQGDSAPPDERSSPTVQN